MFLLFVPSFPWGWIKLNKTHFKSGTGFYMDFLKNTLLQTPPPNRQFSLEVISSTSFDLLENWVARAQLQFVPVPQKEMLSIQTSQQVELVFVCNCHEKSYCWWFRKSLWTRSGGVVGFPTIDIRCYYIPKDSISGVLKNNRLGGVLEHLSKNLEGLGAKSKEAAVYIFHTIWVFPEIMVPPNHPIFIGFSINSTIHIGGFPPIFGNIHILLRSYLLLHSLWPKPTRLIKKKLENRLNFPWVCPTGGNFGCK